MTSTPSCAPPMPGSSGSSSSPGRRHPPDAPIRYALAVRPVEWPSMQWGRPKSLSGLMLVGLALIAVPLLIAILTAVLQIRDLADTGQKIVVQGVTGARASQALFAQIASLERTARLYEVLTDPKLLDVYRAQDERLSATREQLHNLSSGSTRATLEELGQLQQTIRNTVLHAPPSTTAAAASDLAARFAQLSSLVE